MTTKEDLRIARQQLSNAVHGRGDDVGSAQNKWLGIGLLNGAIAQRITDWMALPDSKASYAAIETALKHATTRVANAAVADLSAALDEAREALVKLSQLLDHHG